MNNLSTNCSCTDEGDAYTQSTHLAKLAGVQRREKTRDSRTHSIEVSPAVTSPA